MYRYALPPPNTFALIRATNKTTQVHERNKSTTETHEEPVGYTQGNALVSASVLRTAHSPLHGSEPKPTLYKRVAWEQVGNARVRVCVEKCVWQGKRH